jgi:hypothetical protein
MLLSMNSRTGILLSYLATVAACGSNGHSQLDASDTVLPAGDQDGGAKDYGSDKAGASVDSGMAVYQDAGQPDVAVDVPAVDAPRVDAPVVDAGECRGEISELSTRGWSQPCASLVDAGVPKPTCIGQTPGLYLYRTTCDQRETWRWSYGGSHSQECFYDHGALVGARLQNDTPAFCENASNVLVIGITDGCPGTPATLVLNCNPFVDADWQPWAPDAL